MDEVYQYWLKKRSRSTKSMIRRFHPQAPLHDTNPHLGDNEMVDCRCGHEMVDCVRQIMICFIIFVSYLSHNLRSHVVFRPREKEKYRLRKHRRNDTESKRRFEKMMFEMVVMREHTSSFSSFLHD